MVLGTLTQAVVLYQQARQNTKRRRTAYDQQLTKLNDKFKEDFKTATTSTDPEKLAALLTHSSPTILFKVISNPNLPREQLNNFIATYPDPMVCCDWLLVKGITGSIVEEIIQPKVFGALRETPDYLTGKTTFVSLLEFLSSLVEFSAEEASLAENFLCPLIGDEKPTLKHLNIFFNLLFQPYVNQQFKETLLEHHHVELLKMVEHRTETVEKLIKQSYLDDYIVSRWELTPPSFLLNVMFSKIKCWDVQQWKKENPDLYRPIITKTAQNLIGEDDNLNLNSLSVEWLEETVTSLLPDPINLNLT